MKVVWLYSRIARRSRTGDFTKLDYMEQQDIADAANSALTQVYDALPSRFKQQTQGFTLPGPVALPAVALVNGSKDLATDVFTEEQIGRSVVFSGDPNWNQVLGPRELMNPYQGPTGTTNGTLYGDALWSATYPFDRIVGNPAFANPSLGFFTAREMIPSSVPGWPWWQQVGLPQMWWVQNMGNSQGRYPYYVLKVSPAPDQNYVVNVRFAFWSKRLTPEDYAANADIPVPEQFLESVLVPVALRSFMASPAWKPSADDPRIELRAEQGLQIARTQYGQAGAPGNRIYTPIGY